MTHDDDLPFALHLRDLDPALVSAWQSAFADAPEVEVSGGEIFDATADAVVSPANSFGYMDGGIDLVYTRFFGPGLEQRLQAVLADDHDGELPVGQAVIVPTGHAQIRQLVSAPTMRVPAPVSRTVNVYLAFRAALIAVRNHNRTGAEPIASLLVPGLGTGVGEMPPARAARQMRYAYDAILGRKGGSSRNLGLVWGEHCELLS